MEPLQRSRRGLPCPVCGEENMKCSFNSKVALCVNVVSGRLCGGKPFMPTWIHKIGEDKLIDYIRKEKKPGCEIASREKRDQVYKAFLDMLNISPKHLGQLVRAGVRPGMILEKQYKTVPDFKSRWKYAKKLIQMGFSLEGIPGFYQAEANGRTFWTFAAREGMIIPVRDLDGFITGLRIRLDKPELKPNGEEKRKYRWFSSAGLLMGTSSGTSCHVARGSPDEVWVTEGEKKSDVACDITGKTFISLPGVYEYWKCIPLLKELSPKTIVVAYDADKISNPAVARCEKFLIETLKIEFQEVVILKAEWDLAQAKGIDDLFLIGKKPQYAVA